MAEFRIISVHRNTPLFAVMQAECFAVQDIPYSFTIINNGKDEDGPTHYSAVYSYQESTSIYERLLTEGKVHEIFNIESSCEVISHGSALDTYFRENEWKEPYTLVIDSDCFLMTPDALSVMKEEIDQGFATGEVRHRFGVPAFHVSLMGAKTELMKKAWMECEKFQSECFQQVYPQFVRGQIAFFDQGTKIGIYLRHPMNKKTDAEFVHIRGATTLLRDMKKIYPFTQNMEKAIERIHKVIKEVLERNPQCQKAVSEYGLKMIIPTFPAI